MPPQEPVLRSEFAEIEQRVTRLEDAVGSESSLRAMMDHDLSRIVVRLDAHDRLLQALSVTQSDHTARLVRLEEGQQRLERGQQALTDNQQTLADNQQTLADNQQTLADNQQTLEQVVGHVREGVETILMLLRAAD